MIPPPLPTDTAISSKIFYGEAAGGIRFNAGKALVERIENAHRKAENWLRGRPDIEIVSISNGSAVSGDAASAVFVTVWYRERR